MSQSELQEHITKTPDLFADHEIKDEMVIGPVVLQTLDIAQMPENNSVGLLKNVHIKHEPVGVVKEEHVAEEVDLYADHEIKDEIPDVAEPNCVPSTSDKLNIDTGPYKCNICNKCFVTKHELNHHIMRLAGDKPYKCDICNKCFIRKQSLNCHVMSHTGEKPYKCDICNKCFITKQSLNHHVMRHTGEKPYKCDICNKRFITKHHLNYHRMTHIEETPYKCDICSKRFKTKYCHGNHMKTCGLRFQRSTKVKSR